MKADAFRKLALALPEAAESSHMHHPDFRVRGKIFATLGPGEKWGMVKLTLEQQAGFVREDPEAFQAIPGGWGARGATKVILAAAKSTSLRPALLAAWRNVAPKRLADGFDGEGWG